MKIIIDIPKDKYDEIKRTHEWEAPHCDLEICYRAISAGTPLPKGHGRLIDADALLVSDEECATYSSCFECRMNTECCGDFVHIIKNAPTVIEADKEYTDV